MLLFGPQWSRVFVLWYNHVGREEAEKRINSYLRSLEDSHSQLDSSREEYSMMINSALRSLDKYDYEKNKKDFC